MIWTNPIVLSRDIGIIEDCSPLQMVLFRVSLSDVPPAEEFESQEDCACVPGSPRASHGRGTMSPAPIACDAHCEPLVCKEVGEQNILNSTDLPTGRSKERTETTQQKVVMTLRTLLGEGRPARNLDSQERFS